ncbi:JAB domain-containing protein [Flagellimonas halotolerans]|uniref:JAB domain-containing protein n=1 Tax=Flagellimonas halotolerans TaxID=3112164 RepID=A0ABU6IMC3_9FLAO|nr:MULTISPECIES: JAB domain-containing protein [unclassified Allomuricauda]MEC3964396.1 JAB domain-containing protein [Muricauda sp. SYSU M86414]MEC4264266.1 JAB domain-containing protein [Muricauda sp. SYSU M84420]
MQCILLREDKIDQNREHFWVIGLENNNRILFIEPIIPGAVNRTLAEPMEVDKDITDRLVQVGIIVNTHRGGGKKTEGETEEIV